MKEELIKFIEEETGFRRHPITEAIEKYFNGIEVEWQEKETQMYIAETQMYIAETHTLSCSNGELYADGDFGQLVWNCETLFTDLPHIVEMVYKARIETDKRVKEQIEEITRLITI
jgi:hypothetical protein